MQQYCSEYEDSCSTVICKTALVGLPISIVPSASLGNVKILCCGEPRIDCCASACGGLELTVTQMVTYKIPIEYHINATGGIATTKCSD